MATGLIAVSGSLPNLVPTNAGIRAWRCFFHRSSLVPLLASGENEDDGAFSPVTEPICFLPNAEEACISYMQTMRELQIEERDRGRLMRTVDSDTSRDLVQRKINQFDSKNEINS